MELLFEQQHALAEYFSRKPSTLLIGTEDYERIVCQEHELMQEIMFSQTFHHDGKIFDLNVRVIPWMSGILVLP